MLFSNLRSKINPVNRPTYSRCFYLIRSFILSLRSVYVMGRARPSEKPLILSLTFRMSFHHTASSLYHIPLINCNRITGLWCASKSTEPIRYGIWCRLAKVSKNTSSSFWHCMNKNREGGSRSSGLWLFIGSLTKKFSILLRECHTPYWNN